MEGRLSRLERHCRWVRVQPVRDVLHGPQARWRTCVPRVDAHPPGRKRRYLTDLEEFSDWETYGMYVSIALRENNLGLIGEPSNRT